MGGGKGRIHRIRVAQLSPEAWGVKEERLAELLIIAFPTEVMSQPVVNIARFRCTLVDLI